MCVACVYGSCQFKECDDHGTPADCWQQCRPAENLRWHSNALAYRGPGELDTSYRFVEFETNGVSFLVKADFVRGLSTSLIASTLRLQPMRRRTAKTWSSPISASTWRAAGCADGIVFVDELKGLHAHNLCGLTLAHWIVSDSCRR